MTSEFRPFLGLKSAYWQTVLGSVIKMNRHPHATHEFISLPDGDKLSIMISQPKTWKPTSATVLLIHGLGGSHKAGYMVRLTNKLFRQGYRIVRINLRGCGTGFGHAKNLYHAGRSEDILAVLEQQKKQFPHSPFLLIGFSLGGNIALKLAGELGSRASEYLAKVIGVCPAVDLINSSYMIADPKNDTFRRYFMRKLKRMVKARYRTSQESPPPPKKSFMRLHLHEFDDYYTAPLSGFKNAHDYYQQASALPLLDKIKIPCQILFAQDDPFIDSSGVKEKIFPKNIQILFTQHGGHMGFLGSPKRPGGFRWLDQKLVEWVMNASAL